MDEELEQLRAENAFLRDLLDQCGIDYTEKSFSLPQEYGPPTPLQHLSRASVGMLMKDYVRMMSLETQFMRALENNAGEACSLRIRLPSDFVVSTQKS